MFYSKFKSLLTHNLINIPGWHTPRKIVVIESDDWGAIRMPSREVYEKMLSEGIRVDRDPYCRYDGLETADDLSRLFEVLVSVKDKNGRHPVITADTVVANPDFEAIKANGFSEYVYEPITDTFSKSSRHEGALDMWKEGMTIGLFHPQFHGREHLNVKKWMHALQIGDDITRRSFDYGTFGLTSAVDENIKLNYMGAFNSAMPEDVEEYDTILKEGLDLFEDLFGFRSESFIATTYTWPTSIEASLKKYGVRFLQGMVSQKIPLDDDTTFRYKNYNFLGHKSSSGLIYLQRNCYFEPAHYENKDNVGECMNRIRTAFRWGRPAVISVHRINFITSIDNERGSNNLSQFKQLLNRIVKQWPDVEFMTSNELGNLIVRN